MFQVNQRDGRRWSAADAFLRPALKRPNLERDDAARVLRVELEGDRAVGVRIACGRGRERSIRAEREVILSAGSIQSPQLLLLSRHRLGRRPARGRRGRRATTCPASGATCRTTRSSRSSGRSPTTNTLYGADKPKPLAEWVLRRTGPLTSTVAEVVAFVRTRAGLPAADIQFHMGAAYYEDHGAGDLRWPLRGDRARARVAAGRAAGSGCDRRIPPRQPRIITNSLSEPDDLRSLVDGMELAREIAAQGPMREIVVSELKPGPTGATAADLEADLRRRLMLIYHPVGTCRMSDAGDDAVVDSRAARPRPRGPARGGRVGHAGHPGRQHQRADDHDRRAGGRPDPRRARVDSSVPRTLV